MHRFQKRVENFYNSRDLSKNAVEFQKAIDIDLMLKWLLKLCFIPTILCSMQLPTGAQITPDASLGAEQSTLSPTNLIEGGARRGANLFHSFSEFNIGDRQRIDFTNPAGVDRIITRVTGGTRSQILGTLGVLGSADLFLINPNGIFFGANASLDLNGSFVASTADRVSFANGEFSATAPQAPPLLTISAPIGLQYGSRPGAIQAQQASLIVQQNQTLALLGGDVSIDATSLAAPAGQIELGGLVAGTIDLNTKISFPDAAVRANLVADGSSFETRGGEEGQIKLTGQNIALRNSQLYAGLGSGSAPNATAGDIILSATNQLSLENSTVSNIAPETIFSNGGNVQLNAGSLSLTNNTLVSTSVEGQGNAGDIAIEVRDQMVLDGSGISTELGSLDTISSSESYGVGSAGDITIKTGSLTFIDRGRDGDGSDLSLSFVDASSAGLGNAGKITIAAQDVLSMVGGRINSQINTKGNGNGNDISITARSIDLQRGASLGTSSIGQGNPGNISITSDTFTLSGYILSSTDESTTGEGGKVSITANSLTMTSGFILTDTNAQSDAGSVQLQVRDRILLDRSFISTRTSGKEVQGNGGDITIFTNQLTLAQGSQLTTSTSGSGKAGDVRVVARTIDLFGVQEIFDVAETPLILGSRMFASTEGSGNAGTIRLTANQISIRDRAEIGVGSTSTGETGNLEISANSLRLDQGKITAESASGRGGNLLFNVRDVLLLRRGSSISTTAGLAQGGGDGGNIDLMTGFVVAVPNENSDITANAFRGNGGNIAITTQGIFGANLQNRQTDLSDITASSQFGVNGIVTINTLAVNPVESIGELPVNFSSPAIAQGCQASSRTGRFVNQGRGGVSASPADPLMAETIWQDWGLIDQPQATLNPEIVEAQGWVKQPNGMVRLVSCLEPTDQ